MIIRVPKKTSKKKLTEAIKKMPSQKKGIDLKKYAGKVNFGVDGLSYQKQMSKDD